MRIKIMFDTLDGRAGERAANEILHFFPQLALDEMDRSTSL